MEKNKECSLVQNLLNDYINDNLSDDGFDAVREHLKTCEGCTKMYNQMLEEDKKEHKDDNKIKSKDYMKRYNRKYSSLKTILSFLFIIASIVIMFFLMSYIYESLCYDRTKKAIENLVNEDNLFISRRFEYNGDMEMTLNSNKKNRVDLYLKDGVIKIINYEVTDLGYDRPVVESYSFPNNRLSISLDRKAYRNNELQYEKDEQRLQNEIYPMFFRLEQTYKSFISYGELLKLKPDFSNEYNYIILTPYGQSINYSNIVTLINKSTYLPVEFNYSVSVGTKKSVINERIIVQKGIVTSDDITPPKLDGFKELKQNEL